MDGSALKAHKTELTAHMRRLSRHSMRQMFAADSSRFSKMAVCLEDILFDYSKTRLDGEALKALLQVTRTAGLQAHREKMFSGRAINETEGRAVLHTALRTRSNDPVIVDGKDVMPAIRKVHRDMAAFSRAVRSGKYTLNGARVTDVVNIGIGGSDLGPSMATLALSPYHDGPRTHFVSNVDGADIADTLKRINPETTLFIIASKTFATQETMRNARSARNWLSKKLDKDDVGKHFAALSTNLEATRKFGIDDERTFGFWDWVGGRYSIWSAIGLSVMLAIGPKKFDEFLDGGYAVDQHFRTAPDHENIPVLMALIGIWHRNIWGFSTHAVLPYENRLARFPAYLQQLEMESNGKHVTMDGKPVRQDTGPVVWGEPGTNGQHAFYQLIHQGTSVIPCDFLIAAQPAGKAALGLKEHHQLLVANCLAQSEALMVGKSETEARAELEARGMDARQAKALAPHKVFEGNRPSCTFMYRKLTPKMLGMLIALYEHKVFVQGVIWGINSFDQWGVELGKALASDLMPMITDQADAGNKDASTRGLLSAYHELRKG